MRCRQAPDLLGSHSFRSDARYRTECRPGDWTQLEESSALSRLLTMHFLLTHLSCSNYRAAAGMTLSVALIAMLIEPL